MKDLNLTNEDKIQIEIERDRMGFNERLTFIAKLLTDNKNYSYQIDSNKVKKRIASFQNFQAGVTLETEG